jgi:type IV secretion system protein VirB3
MDQDGSLVEHTLFLAVTRPAMYGGVTIEAYVVNMVLTTVLFLGLGSIKYTLVGVAIHLICRSICRSDPNQFRILKAWAETCGKSRNRRVWGGSSISPLRLTRTFDEKDFER